MNLTPHCCTCWYPISIFSGFVSQVFGQDCRSRQKGLPLTTSHIYVNWYLARCLQCCLKLAMWWTHHNQTYVQGFVLYPIEYCSAALNFSGYRQSLFAVLICDVTICLSIHMHVVLHVMRILSGGINFTDICSQISNYHSAILLYCIVFVCDCVFH